MDQREIILNADQLRKLPSGTQGSTLRGKIKRNNIYIILDNVLDTYNIGSIFRLADAVSAKKLYLCGGTEIPPNHRIKKASINTTEVVDWEYCESAVEAINKLRGMFSTSGKSDFPSLEQYSSSEAKPNREASSIQVIAVEQDPRSIPYDEYQYKFPVALVVGHETEGVSQEVLDICDAIVELPMFGINKSLNVMVSLGIVLYEVLEKVKNRV